MQNVWRKYEQKDKQNGMILTVPKDFLMVFVIYAEIILFYQEKASVQSAISCDYLQLKSATVIEKMDLMSIGSVKII